MDFTKKIIELVKDSEIVELIETNKPYLQVSLYCEAISEGIYEDEISYGQYLEIQGYDAPPKKKRGCEVTLIKADQLTPCLKKILNEVEDFGSFSAEGFWQIMSGELTLEQYELQEAY